MLHVAGAPGRCRQADSRLTTISGLRSGAVTPSMKGRLRCLLSGRGGVALHNALAVVALLRRFTESSMSCSLIPFSDMGAVGMRMWAGVGGTTAHISSTLLSYWLLQGSSKK